MSHKKTSNNKRQKYKKKLKISKQSIIQNATNKLRNNKHSKGQKENVEIQNFITINNAKIITLN